MISYIPFLKAKQNELKAVSELAPDVKIAICPCFDFPRKKVYSSALLASTADRIAESIKRNWGTDAEFYFDDRDLARELTISGKDQYEYMLGALADARVIPVVALGRTNHNAVVAELKRNGEINSPTVAFRADPEDFEDFDAIADQIEYDLNASFEEFDEIDLMLDCRVCTGLNVAETGQQIARFSKKFCDTYNVRRVIVTGSSIPASSREVLETNSTCTLPRRELAILSKARELSQVDLIAGDYATVSPFYSDADLDPRIMQKVMTARLAYTFGNFHYFIRGSSIQSGGYQQYFGLAQTLCGQSFFRSPTYSRGDQYLHEKSRRLGSNCTPGAVIKPLVVAHITYMVLDANV